MSVIPDEQSPLRIFPIHHMRRLAKESIILTSNGRSMPLVAKIERCSGRIVVQQRHRGRVRVIIAWALRVLLKRIGQDRVAVLE